MGLERSLKQGVFALTAGIKPRPQSFGDHSHCRRTRSSPHAPATKLLWYATDHVRIVTMSASR
jgi:hypothetical protein